MKSQKILILIGIVASSFIWVNETKRGESLSLPISIDKPSTEKARVEGMPNFDRRSTKRLEQSGSEGMRTGPLPSPSSVIQAFDQLISEAVHKMPRKADLHRLDAEEVHHTPLMIDAAGDLLGEIAEFLDEHPEVMNTAMKFYLDCSHNDEYPMSVRSVCYSHVLKNGSYLPHPAEHLPREIVETARYLNGE